MGGGTVGLEVGVEDLAVDLDGVVDLEAMVGLDVLEGLVAEETAGLETGTVDLLEGRDGLEVGVDGLEVLADGVNVGRPVGVEGLDPGPPDDDGLRVTELEEFIPILEELNPGDEAGCLGAKPLLLAGMSS